MTSQSSDVGNVDAPFCRPSTRALHDGHRQKPLSFSHLSAATTLPGFIDGVGSSEPAFKRQKLSRVLQEPRESASRTQAQQVLGSKAAPSHVDVIDHSNVLNKKCKEARARTLPCLPTRPCHDPQKRGLKQKESAGRERVFVRKEVQIKPYVPEQPPSAPKYRKDRLADYNPWVGNHPEDTLNESTTKQGFYDKIHISQNETSTARPSVWSSLKHKSGLQILSSLFVSALDQRQSHGTIAASCTFKPPPRVTLTDTKREAWLRDLADASIPLRRLSRTIPHGIRGKSLLDHCVAKEIPITRALWLAKCVGANEIRAFKRKGASGAFAIGGEDKWIRDWTMNVEAFVESVIDECGTPEWRHRINYSLRIVTHLFSENLLDREHYLNWVISSLQNCNLDNIPVWLLVVQIYWKEILRYRQRGKRLAETLLEQMAHASEPNNKNAFTTVFCELAQLSESVMKSVPACFLLPYCWNKYECLLRSHVEQGGAVVLSYFEQISERNLRLRKPSLNVGRSSIHLSERNLIALLDKTSFSVNIGTFADICLKTADDRTQLITVCLEWATSLTRFGHARTYFIVRLFRRWAKRNIDIEQPILGFLTSKPNLPELQKMNVYRLLAELVHSKHLSVSRYLQWLMAKGIVVGRKNVNGTYPSDLQWLFETPLDGLPAPTCNLRQILISSIGDYAKEETNSIAATKAKIVAQVPSLFSSFHVAEEPGQQSSKTTYVSQTVKSGVGRWIRHAVASFFLPHNTEYEDDNLSQEKSEVTDRTLASLEQFRSIRNILENLEEFTILADIVKIYSKNKNVMVLAAATDTVNCHFEIFSAIGATHDLFESLHQQHESICGQQVQERPFVESLSDLGCRLHESALVVRKLRAELLLYEQRHLTAAYSPISDNMAESLQPAESTFFDEVEQVLLSGTIMDKHTLIKIFETITKRMRISWKDAVADHPLINFPELLMQLRSFDPNFFKNLMQDWLDSLLLSKDRPSLLEILPQFISANTISLSTVLERTGYLLDKTEYESNVATIALETLELVTMTDLNLPMFATYKEYRFYDQQHQIIKKSSNLVLPILRAAVQACTDAEIQLNQRARTFVKSVGSRSIMQGLLQQSSNLDAIDHTFSIGLCVHEVQVVIDGILYSSDSPALTESTLYGEFSKLLQNVNVLSASLCKLKLKVMLAVATQFNYKAAETVVSIFKEKARSEDVTVIETWANLMSGLPSDQASPIREAAETELLSYLPSATGSNPGWCKKVLYSMIAIIGATVDSISDSKALAVIAQVTEKITNLLSSPQLVVENSNRECLLKTDEGTPIDETYTYIEIFLRLLTIHYSAVQTSKHPENSLVSLLIALSLLLIHPSLLPRPDLAEHIFDVLTLLADPLPDDARTQCVRALRDQHRSQDPRLLFIFGFSNSFEGEWLQLSTTACQPTVALKPGEDPKPTMVIRPFPLKKWEMMPDATPLVTENDTSLNLRLFGTRRAVL